MILRQKAKVSNSTQFVQIEDATALWHIPSFESVKGGLILESIFTSVPPSNKI